MEGNAPTPIIPSSSAEDPKEQASSVASVLGAATSEIVQSFKPMGGICEAFCGLHVYPDDHRRQIIAFHYCHAIDEDRRQCLIYDRDDKNAKLLRVEYIISEKLFQGLDDDEKKYWHSHKYEVESGLLVQVTKSFVPESVANSAEKGPLKIPVNTYGKTFQFWPVDEKGECSSLVPTGPPQLLVALTKDSQVDLDLLAKRDRMLGISTLEKRHAREGEIQGHPVAEGADQWTHGKPWQIYDRGQEGALSFHPQK
ncbi:hypothetical protein EMPS_05772 [Entomortierella parvispora]|uniref:DUF1264-domain-containing protein n=1 Tax=Entomortierella parvispora TaxID=205924 RepID=A0A9P3HB31_9FUNG|nr:hypothetical protein EMPS_05772 [Entomortierella parvispora]